MVVKKIEAGEGGAYRGDVPGLDQGLRNRNKETIMIKRVLAGALCLALAVLTGCGSCNKCLSTRAASPCCPPPACPPGGAAVVPAVPPGYGP
jgi:hypothetical protein